MARRRASELGSSLVLAPAGLLILVALASIAVDSTIAYLGHRQLENAVTAAANDATTMAIPDGAQQGLQSGRGARPDRAAAQRIAEAEVLHPYTGGLAVDDVATSVDGDTVTVMATGRVRYLFARAIPGMRHEVRVRSAATARLEFR